MDYKNVSANIALHWHFLEEQFLKLIIFLRFYLTKKKLSACVKDKSCSSAEGLQLY